jgi:hypothetical protein
MRTLASEGATLPISSTTRRIPGASPTIWRVPWTFFRLRLRIAFSRLMRRSFSARSTACRSSSFSNGLMM